MNKRQRLLLVGEAIARDLINSYISDPDSYSNGVNSLVNIARNTSPFLSLNFIPTDKEKQLCSDKAAEDIQRYIDFAKAAKGI